jgi:uncharacterized protein (TIGR03437 family)
MQLLRKILLVVLTLAPAGAVTYDFVTFAGPNGANIYPHAINNSGQVVGAFVDSAGASHGFLRSADGTSLTAIDIPGATSTAAASINNSGWIVGSFVMAGTVTGDVSIPGTHGFRLAPDGTLTIIDAPGAKSTVVLQINNSGLIVGEYVDDAISHGFLLAPDGKTFTSFDTGFGDTEPYGMNDNGDVVGRIYVEAGSQRQGWLRSASGVFTFFRDPLGNETAAVAIDNAGQIVGYYISTTPLPHAFLRSPDGSSYTTLETPGTSSSTAVGINNSGEIVGAFGGGYDVRNPDGTFDSIAVPGTSSAASAINDAGQIVGSFSMPLSDGKLHTYGFIRVPETLVTGPLIHGLIGASAFGGTVTVAAGSWIEIYGDRLAESARQWQSSDFSGTRAPVSLDGVSVEINGQAAVVSYISPGQVNAQVPPSVAPGQALVTVTNGSVMSPPHAVTVNAVQPEFAMDPPPSSSLMALFPDGTYVWYDGIDPRLPSRVARAGDAVVLYAIGFGPVTPDAPAGQVVTQLNSLQAPFQILQPVFQGSNATLVPVTVLYEGLAVGFIGLYQFNMVVPEVGFVPGSQMSGTQLSYTLNGVLSPLGGFAVGQ